MSEERYLSALPFLPPLSEATLRTYYAAYTAFLAAVILFGGVLAPIMEVRLGVGGAFCVCVCVGGGGLALFAFRLR